MRKDLVPSQPKTAFAERERQLVLYLQRKLVWKTDQYMDSRQEIADLRRTIQAIKKENDWLEKNNQDLRSENEDLRELVERLEGITPGAMYDYTEDGITVSGRIVAVQVVGHQYVRYVQDYKTGVIHEEQKFNDIASRAIKTFRKKTEVNRYKAVINADEKKIEHGHDWQEAGIKTQVTLERLLRKR